MNRIDDQTLSAYIDNELSPLERAETEAALEQSQALRARLAQLQGADIAAKACFSDIDSEPMPEGLEALIRGDIDATDKSASNVVTFPEHPVRPALPTHPPRRRISAPAWGIAASVVLGVVLFWQSPQGDSNQQRLNQFASNAASGEVLETDDWRAEVISSYQLANGTRCRTLQQHTPDTSRVLQACGEPGNWQWQILNDGESYSTATVDSIDSEYGTQVMSAEEEARWLQKK